MPGTLPASPWFEACVAYGCSAAARRKLRAARSGCEAVARLSPISAWKKEACSGCEARAAVVAAVVSGGEKARLNLPSP